MSVFESPLLVAISPVVISSLVTLYAIRSNRQINPPDNKEFIRELMRENAELRKNGRIKS